MGEGYVLATGHCWACGNLFSFSPTRVPSFRVNGQREPVCESCMNQVNAERKKQGLPPHPIMPGAYSATPEGEI